MTVSNLPEICTIEEVSKALGVSRQTLHTWARKGILPRANFGKRVARYRKVDILRKLTPAGCV